MRIFPIVIALGALMCLATGAQAEGLFFAQDDFVLVYGQPNSPGSAGATFTMDGRLVQWDNNVVAAWFTLSGGNSSAAYVVGGEYRTDYDTDVVLTVTTAPQGAGTLLWQGSGNAYTLVNLDQSGYDATTFDRPDWYNPTIITSGFVSEYQSVGAASFVKTAGTWTYAGLAAPWFGTYDWNFINDGQGNQIGSTGNMQGKLDIVPEPGSLMVCVTGLIGCAGVFMRRRR